MKDYYRYKYGPLPDGRSLPGSACRWLTGFLAGSTSLPLIFQIGRTPDYDLLIAIIVFVSIGLVPFAACLISDYSKRTAAWLLALFYAPAAFVALFSSLLFLQSGGYVAVLFGASIVFGLAAFPAIWYLYVHRASRS